jgi:hypothetical protein
MIIKGNTFTGGTKNVATTNTAVQLVSTSTPCYAVWIGAKQTAGTGSNTGVILIGDSATQNIPILNSNLEGFSITINDASKLYINGTANDGVFYRIVGE